ncbi:glycerol-3-phosphate 1-O-acyltransferase PlsY [Marinithermofilum abyssi]|uniref:glycerol-3-phosphate 1-O-acyltransferase PlsY n=1 Tax=Marinithermofilum abyssi TaxID=1571185 RepID=UPI00166BDA95
MAVVIGYLLGSISFSYLLTRLLKGYDIRQHGSGNAGATNMLRVVGKWPAITVFLLDLLKGTAAVWVGNILTHDPVVMLLSGVASIVGHNWPIFLGFRGGKGIATTIGVTVTLTFQAALISGIFAILAIIFTRFVSLGSLIFAALLPVMIAILDYPQQYIYISFLITLMAFIRHSQNIRRLLSGTESKLGSQKPERKAR